MSFFLDPTCTKWSKNPVQIIIKWWRSIEQLDAPTICKCNVNVNANVNVNVNVNVEETSSHYINIEETSSHQYLKVKLSLLCWTLVTTAKLSWHLCLAQCATTAASLLMTRASREPLYMLFSTVFYVLCYWSTVLCSIMLFNIVLLCHVMQLHIAVSNRWSGRSRLILSRSRLR